MILKLEHCDAVLCFQALTLEKIVYFATLVYRKDYILCP